MGKITDYAALASTQSDDVLPVVDVHDTSMASTGTTKKITVANLHALVAQLNGAVFTGPVVPAVVALTDAATVSVSAALGNDFRLLLTSAVGASRAMGVPAGPSDGQDITFMLTQPASGGPCAITWPGAYSFGAGSAPALSTAANATDLLAFKYRAASSKWLYLGAQLGF